jgi:hypothetical protein
VFAYIKRFEAKSLVRLEFEEMTREPPRRMRGAA